MYSFSLIRIFSHRVFPNEVFNEASPHCGSKGVNPRPPVADIIRHALLNSSSPHYTRLKEWGTGRAGDLAPPLPKKQKFKIFCKDCHTHRRHHHITYIFSCHIGQYIYIASRPQDR
ncbi:unnamed protein product [Cuscuta epithymum]|uniref:Uncharacterized protein n=1 Tax=Cuscuta epithymum TaxID=186058 RepID=A0AAV0F8P6_9ASTE|nr:unnamed protein product [Cuscuta epithymum]